MKLVVLWFMGLLLVSCASVHPGSKAVSTDGKGDELLKISAQVNPAYSDSNHQFIDFTFENKKSSWVRIKKIDFEYGHESDNVVSNIIVGEDLATWANAFIAKKRLEDHNTAMLLSGLMLAGGAFAAASGSKGDGYKAGAVVAGGALAGALALDIRNAKRGAESARMVPKDHLLHRFSIPAEMFVRRWILINVPGNKWATYAYIKIHMLDGSHSSYKVKIN